MVIGVKDGGTSSGEGNFIGQQVAGGGGAGGRAVKGAGSGQDEDYQVIPNSGDIRVIY